MRSKHCTLIVRTKDGNEKWWEDNEKTIMALFEKWQSKPQTLWAIVESEREGIIATYNIEPRE